MSFVRVVPVVALITCAMCGAAAAQDVTSGEDLEAVRIEVDSLPASAAVGSLDARTVASPLKDSGSVLWREGPGEKGRRARWAARVDPDMLMYTEPPSGTEMPVLEPSKTVDPEMISPNNP